MSNKCLAHSVFFLSLLFNTTDFRTVYCLIDNWFRDICCISLESIQLHVIEYHIRGRLNPKNMYCVLPIFHQQLKNVSLPFVFTILSQLGFHPCAFYLTITGLLLQLRHYILT